MKTQKITSFKITIAFLSLFAINSCKSNEIAYLPVVTTTTITDITTTTAVSGGNVTSEENYEITAKGVCWSTSSNPTIADSITNDGTGTGSFTSNIKNLSPNTTYHLRAYATNKFGTAYGNEESFTTNSEAAYLPVVTTTAITDITTTTAVSGGNVTSEENYEITAKGVCWSTSSNPTIADSITNDGTGTGSFTSNIKNLSSNTTYHLRAYATNKFGTAYGDEVSFTTNIESTNTDFAKGADISWLPQMEASGFKFYNASGVEEDCIQILKENGINSIRLRTWVNPSTDKWSGHCSKDETVAMAVRAQNAGMRVMIDFHYSDSWADPSKQVKPTAWANDDFTQLKQHLYDYTLDVMNALEKAGVTPEWVQVGNEITPGMLLPDGGSDDTHFPQLVELINKGYDAIKAVSPNTKVILHIDQGNNNARFRWWFDNATKYSAKYDVIGMSYYPYWLSGSPDYTLSIDDLGVNMNDMVSRYGKEVMIVETGGADTKAQNTYDMIIAEIAKTKAISDGKGLGVFYWEPEGQSSWSGYALSAWMYGKPTKALEAFK